MAFASEELARIGSPRRGALTGDDEYLNQINRMTDQNIANIQHSGDMMQRSEERKWDALNQGINNAFDTYQSVSRRNRQEGREDTADRIASEERERTHGREDKRDVRDDAQFALDKQRMEMANRLGENELASSEETRAWNNKQAVDAKGQALAGPDGAPISNIQQSRIMAQKAQQGQLDQGQAAIRASDTSTANSQYALTHQKSLDRIDASTTALKQAYASGDPSLVNKAKIDLRGQNLSENEILRADDMAQAQLAARGNAQEAQMWLNPGYREAADQTAQLKQASVGVKALQDLRASYVDSLKTRGVAGIGKEDDISADYRQQAADILRKYFGNDSAAHTLETNWTTGGSIKDLDKYIKLTSDQVNNRQLQLRPTLTKYSKDRYINDSLQQVDGNLKYQPQDPETAKILPVFNVAGAPNAGQVNQQFVQQASANGPAQGFFNAPPQGNPPPQGQPPQQPPMAQPMQPAPPPPFWNLRTKNGK